MAYLKNQGGRLVDIKDPNEYNRYLAQGFTIPTKQEVDEHQKERVEKIHKMQTPIIKDGRVYIATVSQGGKDGYGIASNKLIKELKNLDVDITNIYDNQKIGLLFHAPYSLLKMENPYRIIYTMFESTKIPDDWVDFLLTADKVLVPSTFCQKAFQDAGVPAEVVPLGYDSDTFTYKERKRTKTSDFTFLHYNAFNARKGFLELFKAFTQEFAPDEPVKLVLKTTLNRIPSGFPLSPSQYPNIKVIFGGMAGAELADLCSKADAFVFPSRGEGFGMTPLEAMATGLPTIVPNAHGISEYFDSDYMYEVKVKEECPALYSRYKGEDVGKMVVCDVDDLAKQMRYIYEHRKEAKERGKAASEYVKNWTYKKTAEQLKNIFEDVSGQRIVEKPLRNVLNLTAV